MARKSKKKVVEEKPQEQPAQPAEQPPAQPADVQPQA